ncbi:MAG: hypothetical protein ACR2NX_04290 [Chthoniobacterales bacterium]
MPESQLVATAYHEAGHAIASLFYGLPLRSVSIKVIGTSSGRVEPGPALVLLPTRQTCMIINSLLAGAVAETYFTPLRGGWADDCQRAFDFATLLLRAHAKRARQLLHRCRRITEMLIQLAHRDVQRVAIALLKDEELSRQQVILTIHEPIYRPRFDHNAVFEAK